MKSYIINCECVNGQECQKRNLALRKDKKDSHVKISIHQNTVHIGLYKLLRLRDWIGEAITEIEKQNKKAKPSLKIKLKVSGITKFRKSFSDLKRTGKAIKKLIEKSVKSASAKVISDVIAKRTSRGNYL